MTHHETDTARPRRAVVIVSIGERPWIGAVEALARRYAARCGADLIVERAAPSKADFPLHELPDDPGRSHKRLYACKSYFAWRHLAAGYDAVLVLDDTCCVNTTAPDVFDEVPAGHVGYTTTGQADAEKSFQDIARFVRRKGAPPVPFDPDLYMNSGVLIYDRASLDALRPEAIVAAKNLLFSSYPHQSLTYYLLRAAGLPMHRLDRRFNAVPAVHLDKEVRRPMTDIRPHLRAGIHIYHVTGMYRRRDLLIPQVCEAIESGRLA